jgi:hypothetical protein
VYEGSLSGDTVQVGGIKIEAQIFEEYTSSRKHWWFGIQEGFDGAMGLAPPWNSEQEEQKYPNYLAMLQSEDSLEEEVFSLKLPRSLTEQGEITFGGSNPDLYTGAFRNVSLVPDEFIDPYWRSAWKIPLTSLTINATVPLHFPTPNYTAILSDMPILILPAAFVSSFSAAVGVPLGGILWSVVPCARRPFLPQVIFEFGGESFAIDGWDYVFEDAAGENGEILCGIWVEATEDTGVGENTAMIGTGFLKRWYSRWEFGESSRKIGCKYYRLSCVCVKELTVMQLRS